MVFRILMFKWSFGALEMALLSIELMEVCLKSYSQRGEYFEGTRISI